LEEACKKKDRKKILIQKMMVWCLVFHNSWVNNNSDRLDTRKIQLGPYSKTCSPWT
jgi:hypothetical protein